MADKIPKAVQRLGMMLENLDAHITGSLRSLHQLTGKEYEDMYNMVREVREKTDEWIRKIRAVK